MKILIIHNHYRVHGGEDEVVKSEKMMLEQFGHEVFLYEHSNEEISRLSLPQKIRFLLKDAYWSKRHYLDVKELIQGTGIELVHVHNTFLRMSPSIYQACADVGVPVVQTLHNYRFLCPNGLFYRDGHLCEDCLKFGRRSAVVNRCWKNSMLASAVISRVVDQHYTQKILSDKIRQYIVLTEFSRQKYIQNGFPAEKISVKPNFLNFDPGISSVRDAYGLFIGGFFPYKGIGTLVRAWAQAETGMPLKMIGDGPLLPWARRMVGRGRIEFLGRKSFSESLESLRRAQFLVVPSECYENFPRVIVEAFACGTPVVASRLGAMQELVEDQVTGLLFEPGNPGDLSSKIEWIMSDQSWRERMGQSASREYEEKYTLSRNYEMLMDIYRKTFRQKGESVI